MNMTQLVELLTPWLSVETWHTGHPMDKKRFHLCIQNIVSTVGSTVDADSFSEAMTIVCNKLYPTWDVSYKKRYIDEYSLNAEYIFEFLSDTQQL